MRIAILAGAPLLFSLKCGEPWTTLAIAVFLFTLPVRAHLQAALLGDATAAIGSLFAAIIFFGAMAIGAPIALTVLAVVGGYILAASLIDIIDNSLQVKERVAQAAR